MKKKLIIMNENINEELAFYEVIEQLYNVRYQVNVNETKLIDDANALIIETMLRKKLINENVITMLNKYGINVNSSKRIL